MIRELEKTGKTVEEAYAAACEELGVEMDDFNVSYEILEMPARKFFRTIPAKVLVKVETPDVETPVVEPAVVEAAPVTETPATPAVTAQDPAPVEKEQAADPAQEGTPIDLETSPKVKAAVEYLQEVITAMGVSDFTMTATEKGGASIIGIKGEHLGVLIGRRGETMESLSYLASLVANRVEGDYIKLGLDVAGYRDKREQDLTDLARRLGAKVIKNNRAFAMETMNPYERRLIHAAISAMDGVRSESIGEGKDRRVVIYSTAEGANNEFPETERKDRYQGNRGGRGNGRGGNFRGNGRGGNGGRGGYRGNAPRTPRAPKAEKTLPTREFAPIDAAAATPVAPKRTERIDDMADFGFGKIEL